MKTKLPIKFKADLELIDFAKDFAANYKKLSSGFYFSDSTMDIAKYQIIYDDEIIMSNGERPTTTLRVGSETSNINIDRGFITKRPHTESTVFGAIIWCQARFFYLKIKNQISNFDSYAFADIDTLDCVVKNGYSPVDYYLSSLHIFKSANPIAGLNQYRVTKMNEWLYFDSNQELYHTIHLLNKYMPKDGH